MHKSIPGLLATAVALLAAGCSADPVVEPTQQMEPAPAEAAPAPAPAVVEAPPSPPDEPPPPPPTASKPEQVVGGKYRVCVASEPAEKDAGPWVKKLEAAGIQAATEATQVNGKSWTRVVATGLRNGKDARAMVAYLDEVVGIKGAWVVPKGGATPAAAPAEPAAPVQPAAAPEPAPMPAPAEPAAPAAEPKVPDAEHPQN